MEFNVDPPWPLINQPSPSTHADKARSFYVGDMAGRPMDPNQSATDKEFATNIGVAFKTPEDVFGCVRV